MAQPLTILPPPPPPPPPASAPTAQRIAAIGWLGILGCAAGVIGSFMAWITVSFGLGSVDVNGTNGDGKITAAIGIVAGLLALFGLTTGNQGKIMLAGMLSIAGTGISVFEWRHVASKIDALGTNEIATASVGTGIWVMLAGFVVATICLFKSAPPDSSRWWRRKRLFAPTWAWIATVIVLVGGAIGATIGSPDGDGSKASPTGATEVAGTPAGITGDRANPVPAGDIADIGKGWRLQVLKVNTDAAAAIAAENQFNDPPPPGSTFTLITVALGYFGLEDPKSAFETTISAVGAANVELTAKCGSIPQELNSFGELFSGGVVVGNVCFVTTPEDAASLQLYASGQLFGGDDVFLATSPAPADAVPMPTLTGPQPEAASSPSRLTPTPRGVAVDIGEGWKLSVSGAARDITDETLAENQFNEHPPDGFRFIGIDVTYSYDGAGSASPFTVTTKAVGDDNRELGTECGVTPGEVDLSADVFSGGTVSGTICFVVPTNSTALVLYATAGSSGSNIMFATA
jgi:hypothetical protein